MKNLLNKLSTKTQTLIAGRLGGLFLILISTLIILIIPSFATNNDNSLQLNETHSVFKQLSDIIGYNLPPNDQQVIDQVVVEQHTTTLSSSMLKTYIRANSMRAYHTDLHSYRPEAKFSGDPNFVDSENRKDKLRCSRHLAHFNELLRAFHMSDPVLTKNSLDSVKLADTFGRPEAGLLKGSQFWLGDYDSCLEFSTNIQSNLNENLYDQIKGQYCLGITQYPNWNPEDSKTSIKIGLCLPETCTTSMLNEESELFNTAQAMMKYQLPGGLSTNNQQGPYGKLTLREVYCLPHETSQARQYSYSALAFLQVVGSFMFACLVATTMDFRERMNQVEEKKEMEQELNKQVVEKSNVKSVFIESFSIAKNVNKFFHIREEVKVEKHFSEQNSTVNNNKENVSINKSIFLNSITGLKCIGLCWIIAAHTFMMSPIPSKNLIDADKWTKFYLADFYLAAHLIVDTFFCLSGVLAAYFLFKEGIDKIKTKHWIILTIHRYWRLAPIYLLCYWYSKSIGHQMNSGPLWDYNTSETSPRLNCQRESWWYAILLISDFKSPKQHCVPFAWFISNGIKFWILTPFFLILIHKSIRRGYNFIATTLLGNIILVAILAIRSTVDMKAVVEFKPESADNMLNNMEQVYTRPYSRISPYLIGLIVGHMIYMIETNQFKVNISKNTDRIISIVCGILVFIMIFALKLANSMKLDDSAIPIVFSICTALIRPIWAICTCWLVFSLARGQASGLGKFLSAKFWRVLVKVSFCGYLAQGEVIAQLYLSTPVSNSYSYVDMLVKPIETIAITVILSFFMVITLEYPLVGIEKLILPSKRPQKEVQVEVGNNQMIEKNSSETQKRLTGNHIKSSIDKPKVTFAYYTDQKCNGGQKLKTC